MLGHEAVIDTDTVGACHSLSLRGGLRQHRTDDRHESQPRLVDVAAASVAVIGTLGVHRGYPERVQSEVCLSPAALRDLHAQSRGRSRRRRNSIL